MKEPADRRAGPATGREADTLMFSLLDAAKALESRIEAGLAAAELSLAKYGVLSSLVEADEALPLSELAERQACVRSNITQLVDRLEGEGLVQRVRDAEDRRSVRAALTAEGRERQKAGRRELERVRTEFMSTLSDADRAALERLLATLG